MPKAQLNNLPPTISLFDLEFFNCTKAELIDFILANIESKQLFFATPNPEIILAANQNPEFKQILTTTINIPDGIGLLWAANFLSQFPHTAGVFNIYVKFFSSAIQTAFTPNKIKTALKTRLTGTDLMQEICLNPKFNHFKKFLLGGTEEAATLALNNLKLQNPEVNIVGSFSSVFDNPENLKAIQAAKPDILFVAFGAPKQEIWLSENLKSLPSIKFAIGIGGAFDFISNTKRRAPKLFQNLNLEWLFRLIIEPWRYKRIFNAVVKFPLWVLTNRLKQKS